MLKEIRVRLVRLIIELAEGFYFNPKLLKFYKKQFGNSLNIVIDVGSNVGQTIDLILKINPSCKIYGFEPNPKLFEFLTKKYKKQKNVILIQKGVSDLKGTKTFHENILHSTSTLEDINYDSEYLKRKANILGVEPEKIVAKTYSIEVVTLSDFINDTIPNQAIDLIKIDTEGHEYNCLAGLFNSLSTNPRFIQLENHNDDMYVNNKSFAEITALLEKNGYVLNTTIKHKFGDFDEVIFEKK